MKITRKIDIPGASNTSELGKFLFSITNKIRASYPVLAN